MYGAFGSVYCKVAFEFCQLQVAFFNLVLKVLLLMWTWIAPCKMVVSDTIQECHAVAHILTALFIMKMCMCFRVKAGLYG